MDYRGVLYFGLMIKNNEAFVLEYNVRFGDPEAQVILPLIDGDWADVFYQVAQGKMPSLKWKNENAICVVIGAAGYPGRRAHKIGWPRLLFQWWTNGIYIMLFGKSYSKVWKEIR
jgi:phosphoribosylamine-glycine ligase